CLFLFFFFQAEDGIRDFHVTGVQTCALPILSLPISTVPPCGARTCAAELASRNAKSTVIGTVPTRPRMPSVPKYRLLMDSSLGRSEERRVGKECRSRWRTRAENKTTGERASV